VSIRSKHNQAAALVAQLTLAEKARLCSGHDFWHLEGVARVGLEPVMVTDGPHGLRKQVQDADHVGLNKSVPATCFPTSCALAASWDVHLLREVGVALGEECAAEHVTVLLGPGLNIKRHPLCGRNFEYFSEDPLLTGKIAAAMVQGVQSQGVGTSIKHFAVNNQEHGRMYVDAVVDERTLREIYLRGFEIAVREAQPWTVMCAYNRVNGTYCGEHDWLLNKVLRDEWGFEGLVMTDWGATNDRVQGVASGLDLEMPGSGGVNDALVEQAVENGYLKQADLDQSIERNVALSLLGGDLQSQAHAVDLQAHHGLAHKAAAESAVLLKNQDGLLPLSTGANIAVIGAFARKPRFQGTGSSQVNPTQLDNAWDALTQIAANITYAPGYDPRESKSDQALIDEAVATARDVDVAVVFAGLPNIYESEGFDRTHLNLPDQHNELIRAVCAANPNTVVVLSNGAPVAMPWASQVRAILEAYLAGQAGGAVADLLFGVANPSGKLAETFPFLQTDVPADANFPGDARQVHYREGLYVGYRYFDTADKPVLFPFGHGLSYTSFGYGEPRLSADTYHTGGSLKVELDITNTGAMAGAEVVQLYAHVSQSEVYRPVQELRDFAKVHLAPGETAVATFALTDRTFSFYDQGHGEWIVEAGDYELRIGASSRDIRARAAVNVVSEQTVSRRAAAAQGPDLTRPHHIDDYTFTAMLGKDVPAPESSRPFHENSSVAEIGGTWLGAKFKAKVVEGFTQNMGGGGSNETLNKMFEEMANNMPLRGIVLFSRGGISMTQIRLMLALLNHRYVQALKLWWRQYRRQ